MFKNYLRYVPFQNIYFKPYISFACTGYSELKKILFPILKNVNFVGKFICALDKKVFIIYFVYINCCCIQHV